MYTIINTMKIIITTCTCTCISIPVCPVWYQVYPDQVIFGPNSMYTRTTIMKHNKLYTYIQLIYSNYNYIVHVRVPYVYTSPHDQTSHNYTNK